MAVSIETVISRLGGPQETARIAGVGTEAVRKWRQARTIPPKHWLTISKASGLPISDLQPPQDYAKHIDDNAKVEGATALLLLEDGTQIWGEGAGYHTTSPSIGEICFSTSMTGYQETLSDPSYAEQLIVFTAPHIGNTGTNKEDNESQKPLARGAIVRDLCAHASNYRTHEELLNWLKGNKIPAISGVDTRTLTRKIRDEGPQKAALFYPKEDKFPIKEIQKAIHAWSGLSNAEIAGKITCAHPYKWHEPVIKGFTAPKKCGSHKRHVVVIDYGVKHNILRCLTSCGCDVTVVPAQTPSQEILTHKPDGILLSNGPGDPAATAHYAVPIIKELIQAHLPIMGICLGHQLLTHCFGTPTFKMKHGHRGVNQPVKNLMTGRVDITSQNHGFAASEHQKAAGNVEKSYISLFDKTNEGLRHKTAPIFSVQFHPEASPGPSDCYYLFEQFMHLIDKRLSH